MKRISNWSWLGYIIGLVFSLGSFIRYYIIFPDVDKALVYVGIGFIVCGLAWVYNKLQEQGNTLTALEEYLADKQ